MLKSDFFKDWNYIVSLKLATRASAHISCGDVCVHLRAGRPYVLPRVLGPFGVYVQGTELYVELQVVSEGQFSAPAPDLDVRSIL